MGVNKIILNGEEIELTDEQARRIIGSGTLETVAQTLIGGINELDTKVGDGILTTDNKALIGSVNEINEKISTINGDITNINETITNISGSASSAVFKTFITVSSSVNRDITSKNTYVTSYSLKGYETMFEGFIPIMLLNAYADNGIIVSNMEYDKNTKDIKVTIYNPYSDTRNCGRVNYTPLFIKDGAFIKI